MEVAVKLGFGIGVAALVVCACTGRVVDSSSATVHDGGTIGAGGNSADSGNGSPNTAGGRSSTGGRSATGGSVVTGGTSAGGGPADATVVACDFDGSTAVGSVRAPARVEMATVCSLDSALDCTKTAAGLLAGYVCGPEDGPPPAIPGAVHPTTFRDVGCGVETVWTQGGYGGPTYTFSLATGDLIGAGLSSDVNFGPCNTFSYFAGTAVECKDARRYICVAPGDLAPDAGSFQTCTQSQAIALLNLPERPECDCSVDPGIDPCFGPGSCGCWCQRIVTLKEICPGVR